MFNHDNQTSACCRAIIRFVNGNRFISGDKLPSQQELSRILGYCHNTMSPAMDMLVDSGMFTRKRRLGTLLVDPAAYPSGLWRVALPHGPFDGNPSCKFGTILCMSLQSHLQKRGCDVRLYQRLPEYAESIPHSMGHFGKLQKDAEDGLFDAIMTTAFFSAETSEFCRLLNIPLCHVGGWEHTLCRVELDTAMLIEKAVEVLRARSCRSFALIAMDNFEHLSPKAFSAFKKYSAENAKSSSFELLTAGNVLDGEKIVMRILEREPSRRPDSLIILNDILGLGVASALNGAAYSPKMVIQANRQMPLFYAVPVIRFEFDVDLLAETAAGLIVSKLLQPESPDIVIAQPPELRMDKIPAEDSGRILSA